MIPDRVSIDRNSPYYWPAYKSLAVRFDGRERLGDVHEFCVSEGWIMARDGADHANGRWRLKQLFGVVEPYLKAGKSAGPTDADAARIEAAKAKRARKAAKRK